MKYQIFISEIVKKAIQSPYVYQDKRKDNELIMLFVFNVFH